MSSARASRPVIAVYAAATAAVPALSLAVLAWGPVPQVEPVAVSAPTTAVPVATATATATDSDAVQALAGIWSKHELGLDGDPVAFYYFHGDGKGLYRYGRVGLSNTHSFDYTVEQGVLVVRFRKTGEEHRLAYTVENEAGRDCLVLAYDPEERAHGTRYFRDRPGPIDPHGESAADLGPEPAGHMWIDLQRYATGGVGFGMYQFRPAGIDGRGVGWFHRGDFDDWSTESFSYRIAGDRLDVHFTLADQGEVTRFAVDDGQPRSLRLQADPRDYWHLHAYDDMGPSFGAAAPEHRSMLGLVTSLADYSRTE